MRKYKVVLILYNGVTMTLHNVFDFRDSAYLYGMSIRNDRFKGCNVEEVLIKEIRI